MLIPFLDILCSLIGVLILIIVVLCVAQTQQANGRTAADLAQAQEHRNLLKAQELASQEDTELQAQLAALDKLVIEMAGKERQVAELRKRLEMSGDSAKANKELAASLQKKVEDLVRQIEIMQVEIPPLQAEIGRLKQELAKRQIKPDATPVAIAVRPSGSGSSAGRRHFFIELTGNTLVIHKSKTDKARIPAAAVGTDNDLNAFLGKVKSTPNASLVFLLRANGWPVYGRAAGYAESRFGIVTSKLPLPGDGELDLGLFENR